MSPSPSAERVTLPSIQEMFPDHLLGLSGASRAHGREAASPAHRAPLEGRALGSPIAPANRGDPAPRSASSPTAPPGAQPPRSPGARRPSSSDEERRHTCPQCGKAFNRPSSLAIHVNTHTGAKPFQCPFPGCGRRFNVNSNMRRHLRNHTSPSRPLNSSAPYTYPLTTQPRAPFAQPQLCRASPDTASDEDELASEPDAWDTQLELERAQAGVARLRVRGYSTSSMPSPPVHHHTLHPHYVAAPRRERERERAHPAAARPRSHTYAHLPRPTVLHPSSDAYRRPVMH